MDLSFIIPVYNQKDSIAYVCDALEHVAKNVNLKCEILLCDDASQDGSTEVVKEISSRRWMIKDISHKRHQGFGATFRELLRESQGTIVIYLDPALSFDIDHFSAILAKIRSRDIVIASRLVGDNNSKNVKIGLSSRIYQFLSKVFLNVKVQDLESAMVLMRREKVIDLTLRAKEKGIFPEMYALGRHKNLIIKEVSVDLRRNQKIPHPAASLKDFIDLLMI